MRRDGKIYKQSFKSNIEGAVPTSEVLVEKDPTVPQVTGTIITYKPDEFPFHKLKDYGIKTIKNARKITSRLHQRLIG